MICHEWKRGETFKVALFYRYVPIKCIDETIASFRQQCTSLGLLGRILVGSEGINGTLAGSISAIDSFAEYLHEDERFKLMQMKYSLGVGDHLPFLNLSIRQVDEIVSTGPMKSFIEQNISYDSTSFGGIQGTGKHLTPEEFHNAVTRQDGIVLDIRNKFEYDIGHFDNSVGLDTFYYSETWDALDNILGSEKNISNVVPTRMNLVDSLTTPIDACDESTNMCEAVEQLHTASSNSDDTKNLSKPSLTTTPAANTDTNIYMYCTGGIRCEKASAYLKGKGYNNVFQLEGGIHKYLEAYPTGGAFQGKNFVFDSRVSMAPTGNDSGSGSGDRRVDDVVEDSTNTTDTADCTTDVATNNSTTPTAESADNNSIKTDLTKNTNSVQHIVGQCIDCHTAHDVYSGFITCTVCRMPVLVCPTCVKSNTHPGEYHCIRHRDLKSCYFTVLERYDIQDLQCQYTELNTLLQESLQINNHIQMKKRVERSKKMGSVVEGERENTVLVTQKEAVQAAEEQKNKGQSKNRRNTLRKQLDRISQRMELLKQCDGSDIPTLPVTSNVHDAADVARNECTTSPSTVIDSTISKTTDDCTSTSTSTTPTTDQDKSDGESLLLVNPKSRGGWGFWRT